MKNFTFFKNVTAWTGTIRKSVLSKCALGTMLGIIITACAEGLLMSLCHRVL